VSDHALAAVRTRTDDPRSDPMGLCTGPPLQHPWLVQQLLG
jgi:hypothetical protein